MGQPTKNVVVLGSTGSIGLSTLEVIAASDGAFRVVALSAHSNVAMLERQAQEFAPEWVVATDADAASGYSWSQLPDTTELLVGPDALRKVVANQNVDIVVSAIVGAVGLEGTWAALEAGKTVALANKESLVMGGPLVTELASSGGGRILPVDSEHSAVFQVLQAGGRDQVHRVVLTASGGPFRECTPEELANVSVEQALAHPNWDMGPKITVDSATLMNKALEIIEARWLFDLDPSQIAVVIHPQSIVHSMVEYIDGSVVAQLGPPDMRLPIQYALTWPERCEGVAEKLDFSRAMQLDFFPPDLDRFPAIGLGLEVARIGGTAGAVLNAANESAVEAFLSGRLAFNDIVPACRSVLKHHEHVGQPTLKQLIASDAFARKEIARWICR